MESQLIGAALGVLLVVSAPGQVGGRGVATMGDSPRMTAPEANRDTIFLSGKVFLDDGTPLTEPAAIQTICDGKRRTETYTDRYGSFSFRFGEQPSISGGASLGDAGITANNRTSNQFLHNLRDCEMQAVLPGFASEIIVLNSRITNLESTDLGKLELHRLVHAEGLAISATSATAPDDARRALQKAVDGERRNKWKEAQQFLEKAVQIYPKYAVAWFELGVVQVHQNDIAGARHSFGRASTVDPKYVSPYQGLAQLAAQAQHWQELVETTNKILELNPVSFPDAWFLNGVGSYYLQNFSAAEKSAREGLKLDEEHRIPKLEYLLAMAVMQRRDYPEAAEHMRQYLRLAATPNEVAEAQKELSEIRKLSAAASVVGETGEKK